MRFEEQPTALLKVIDLAIRIATDSGAEVRPVDGVTFDIKPSESVGVLGESGSGKTTLALTLLRALVPGGRVDHGNIVFQGRDLLSASSAEIRRIRGAEIAMIYQDSSVLNPVIRVGDQVAEVFRAHHDCTMNRCRQEAAQMLDAVGLTSGQTYAAFPHQLSGGQRQRVVIAQALVCRPKLVIADEPTASLDTATASGILELLVHLKKTFKTAILLISHDPAVLRVLCDRILVMYAGQLIEQGPTQQVFQQPLHPYTRALLACELSGDNLPARSGSKRGLPFIPGNSPDLLEPFPGCCFENRCVDRIDACKTTKPAKVEAQKDHWVRCIHFDS